MDKTAYMQLVREQVSKYIRASDRAVAFALCDQYTSITEAEGLPRWTFRDDILHRAIEARSAPIEEPTWDELIERSLASNRRSAYAQAGTALKLAEARGYIETIHAPCRNSTGHLHILPKTIPAHAIMINKDKQSGSSGKAIL